MIGGAAGSPWAGRTFIILNPNAGQEATAQLRRGIGAAFAARGASFDLVETEHAGHATALARDAAALGYRCVCIAGGDGTLAEAATGLAGSRTPLGILPRGTANQVALNLGIPIALEDAVEVVVRGTATRMDLGRIGDRNFALVAGAGFDAAVMATATRGLKERWGFAAYVYAAVKEALGATPRRFRVIADGAVIELDAVTVMIANVGELFAGFLPVSFPLAPDAARRSWQDGLLEVVVLAPHSIADFAGVLWNASRRRFGVDDRLLHFQAREVTIEADPPIAVQIDGDPAGVTPITAVVAPEGVHVMTP